MTEYPQIPTTPVIHHTKAHIVVQFETVTRLFLPLITDAYRGVIIK